MAEDGSDGVGHRPVASHPPGTLGEAKGEVGGSAAPRRLARFLAAHGIQGRLRAEAIEPDPDWLFGAGPLSVVSPAGERLREATIERFVRDEGARRTFVVALAGIRTRKEANRLRGAYLVSEASPSDELPRRDHWQACRGLDVVDETGRAIGRVESYEESGGRGSWRMEAGGAVASIPTGWEHVRTIDLRTKRIVVRAIGLDRAD